MASIQRSSPPAHLAAEERDRQVRRLRYVHGQFKPTRDLHLRQRLYDLQSGLRQSSAAAGQHTPPGADAGRFTCRHQHRTITGGVGHNRPQEVTAAFAQAIIDADKP